jgi:hypothetical protein
MAWIIMRSLLEWQEAPRVGAPLSGCATGAYGADTKGRG